MTYLKLWAVVHYFPEVYVMKPMTYRFDIKLEHLLHVGRDVGQQGVCAPVGTHVTHYNGPYGHWFEELQPGGALQSKTNIFWYNFEGKEKYHCLKYTKYLLLKLASLHFHLFDSSRFFGCPYRVLNVFPLHFRDTGVGGGCIRCYNHPKTKPDHSKNTWIHNVRHET